MPNEAESEEAEGLRIAWLALLPHNVRTRSSRVSSDEASARTRWIVRTSPFESAEHSVSVLNADYIVFGRA
jgi:hypothetical protein